MNTFVTHDQLLIILILVFIGASIFAYAMLKHAIELRRISAKVIEDLAVVQVFIDVELAASIDLISANLGQLNTNSDITFVDLEIIKNSTIFGPGFGGLGEVTVAGWNLFI